MPSYIFDIIIIAILALFAWRGAAKGLILTLCGLATVFVGYFGAQFLSNAFCEPVAGIIRPVIASAMREALPESVQGALDGMNGYLPAPSASPGAAESPETSGTPEAAAPPGGTAPQTPSYTVGQVMDDIREAGIFNGIYPSLQEAVDSGRVQQGAFQSPVDALADYAAKGVARSVLFALIFLAVTVGWFLLSHALDLAFKLPILSQINLIGGLAIGLLEGALIVAVLVWLGQVVDWIPAEPDSPLLRLFTVDNLWKLWEDLPV